MLLLQEDERLLAGLRVHDAEALCLEIIAQHLGERRLVLDDQDLRRHRIAPPSAIRCPR